MEAIPMCSIEKKSRAVKAKNFPVDLAPRSTLFFDPQKRWTITE